MKKIIFEKSTTFNKIRDSVRILNQGGILIHPTENLYGFGARIDKIAAIDKISSIKKRNQKKGYIVLISNREQLQELVKDITPLERQIINKYWPGPLTIIFRAKEKYRKSPFCFQDTIAIREVGNPITKKIISRSNKPIISTSLNISGEYIISDEKQIEEKFYNRVEGFVIDKIHEFSGKPSTIILVDRGKIQVLRKGEVKI